MNILLLFILFCATGFGYIVRVDKCAKFKFNLLYGIFDLKLKKDLYNKTKVEQMEVLLKNAYYKQMKLDYITESDYEKVMRYVSSVLRQQPTTADDVNGGWTLWLPITSIRSEKNYCKDYSAYYQEQHDTLKRAKLTSKWKKECWRRFPKGYYYGHEYAYARICVDPVKQNGGVSCKKDGVPIFVQTNINWCNDYVADCTDFVKFTPSTLGFSYPEEKIEILKQFNF